MRFILFNDPARTIVRVDGMLTMHADDTPEFFPETSFGFFGKCDVIKQVSIKVSYAGHVFRVRYPDAIERDRDLLRVRDLLATEDEK